MYEGSFNKLYWGFIFIAFSFRIQGFDILPDIVGYLLFASAFSNLVSSSTHFSVASKYNIIMIILSFFSIYQRPVQGGGVHLGIFSIPLAIAAFIISLLVVYYLFMGIKDMAEKEQQLDLASESSEKWNQFLILRIASLFSFILILIPALSLVYIIVMFVASIIILLSILDFLKRCSKSLNTLL
jgi:hypothetical protein